MGASVEIGANWIEAAAGPAAMRTRKLRAIDADFNHIPDAAMTVAVLALFADGPSTLRNIGSWRVKETDRIAAMATELQQSSARRWKRARISLKITPPAALLPADHRHVRRPPHGDVLLARRAGRRARCASTIPVAWQRLFRIISACWPAFRSS